MNMSRLNPWNWFDGENALVKRQAASETGVREVKSPVDRLHSDIDSLFEDMFRGFMTPTYSYPVSRDSLFNRQLVFRPRLDVSGDETAYTVAVEVPGVKPEEVSLELRDRTLIIHGEKKNEEKVEEKGYYRMERVFGTFQRVLALPEDADAEHIEAVHKDGVLNITIPRRKLEQAADRKIAIRVQ